jgi:hypothetical protein|uniref:Uncharacterized protein n=1 Tax=Zea mays TaxID=4577 RepID=A0A804R5S4_MAIZE
MNLRSGLSSIVRLRFLLYQTTLDLLSNCNMSATSMEVDRAAPKHGGRGTQQCFKADSRDSDLACWRRGGLRRYGASSASPWRAESSVRRPGSCTATGVSRDSDTAQRGRGTEGRWTRRRAPGRLVLLLGQSCRRADNETRRGGRRASVAGECSRRPELGPSERRPPGKHGQALVRSGDAKNHRPSADRGGARGRPPWLTSSKPTSRAEGTRTMVEPR